MEKNSSEENYIGFPFFCKASTCLQNCDGVTFQNGFGQWKNTLPIPFHINGLIFGGSTQELFHRTSLGCLLYTFPNVSKQDIQVNV